MIKRLSKAAFYPDNDTLTVKPLTAAERKWIDAAAAMFAAMPARLKLMEGGDVVSVVDAEGASLSNCADGDAERDGIVLARLPSATFKIFGVSA